MYFNATIGVAERFGCTEQVLRQALFKETNMMYPELLTRTDIKLFLPPIGGKFIKESSPLP